MYRIWMNNNNDNHAFKWTGPMCDGICPANHLFPNSMAPHSSTKPETQQPHHPCRTLYVDNIKTGNRCSSNNPFCVLRSLNGTEQTINPLNTFKHEITIYYDILNINYKLDQVLSYIDIIVLWWHHEDDDWHKPWWRFWIAKKRRPFAHFTSPCGPTLRNPRLDWGEFDRFLSGLMLDVKTTTVPWQRQSSSGTSTKRGWMMLETNCQMIQPSSRQSSENHANIDNRW